MSKIKSKNTKPEIRLRKELFKSGLRYRIHYKKILGKPDIVFISKKVAIFVNGCFWHHHEGCKKASTPKSNTSFWEQKIESNLNRDKNNHQALMNMGWKVIVVWECELDKIHDLPSIINNIKMYL